MTEAYVLAGELHKCNGDIAAGFAAYETRLRTFITNKQKSAREFASSFAPKTAFGIWLRNVATTLMVIPPIADLLIGASVKDDFDLPHYEI
jgi:2-polyprenyl-6-methoxyphenol hydroxylase-like FAD-dependent oxidoreductase